MLLTTHSGSAVYDPLALYFLCMMSMALQTGNSEAQEVYFQHPLNSTKYINCEFDQL